MRPNRTCSFRDRRQPDRRCERAAACLAADSRGTPAQTERQWLSIGEVHQKLEAAGYRKVEKIEREHGAYEAGPPTATVRG